MIDQPLYAYFQNEKGIMGVGWSPNHLVAVEAFETRIEFFRKRANRKMVRDTAERELLNLYWYVRMANENQVDAGVLKDIRKKFQKILIKYCEFAPIQKKEDYYAIAFPHLIVLYYHYCGVKKRLECLFCHK